MKSIFKFALAYVVLVPLIYCVLCVVTHQRIFPPWRNAQGGDVKVSEYVESIKEIFSDIFSEPQVPPPPPPPVHDGEHGSVSPLPAGLPTIEVSSTAELLAALGPDRIVVLNRGSYLFEGLYENSPSKYYAWGEEENEAHSLVIKGVKNLRIESRTKWDTTVLTRHERGWTLVFEDCQNVELDGLVLGHTSKGFCTGGVVLIKKGCSNFRVTNSILFGCGTIGLRAEDSRDIKFADSIIRGCTYGIAQLERSAEVNFKRCDFIHNECFTGIEVKECKDITIQSSFFGGNRDAGNTENSQFSLIEGDAATIGFLVENCQFSKGQTSNHLVGKIDETGNTQVDEVKP